MTYWEAFSGIGFAILFSIGLIAVVTSIQILMIYFFGPVKGTFIGASTILFIMLFGLPFLYMS